MLLKNVTTANFTTEACNKFYFYEQRTHYGIIQRQIENALR
jgi:hypothetical protein